MRLRMLRNPGYGHLVDCLCTVDLMMYPSPIVFPKPGEPDHMNQSIPVEQRGRPVDIDKMNEDFMHALVTKADGDARLIWESMGEWLDG